MLVVFVRAEIVFSGRAPLKTSLVEQHPQFLSRKWRTKYPSLQNIHLVYMLPFRIIVNYFCCTCSLKILKKSQIQASSHFQFLHIQVFQSLLCVSPERYVCHHTSWQSKMAREINLITFPSNFVFRGNNRTQIYTLKHVWVESDGILQVFERDVVFLPPKKLVLLYWYMFFCLSSLF